MWQWMPILAQPGSKERPHQRGSWKKWRVFLTALMTFVALAGCEKKPPAPSADIAELSGAEELTDVAGHPQEEYILEGLRLGFWPVPSDGRFQPDEDATREEFLVALWRLAGQPDVSLNGIPSRWNPELRKALAWADAAGCLDSAASVQTFAPDELITRQAAMETLYACNGNVSGLETMLTGIYDDAFADSAKLSGESKRALYWGFYNVLIREKEPGKISPSGALSRGDMAEALIRYWNDFQSEPPQN